MKNDDEIAGIIESTMSKNYNLEKLIRQANLPLDKTLDGFDFSNQRSFSPRRMRELATGTCLSRNTNILIFGLASAGKTHLASALGRHWCSTGRPVRFYSAPALVKTLKSTAVKALLKNLEGCEALIVDDFSEIFHLHNCKDLLELLQQWCQNRSVVLNSKLDFHRWGPLLDYQGSTALIDLIVGRSIIIQLDAHRCLYKAPEAKKP